MPEPVSIIVGGRAVIASGAICTTRSDNDIEFGISNLKFILRFISDDDKELSIKAEEAGENRLLLSLYNFNNVIGSSFDIVVGNIKEKPLNLAATVHLIGSIEKGRRFIIYTFSLGGGDE